MMMKGTDLLRWALVLGFGGIGLAILGCGITAAVSERNIWLGIVITLLALGLAFIPSALAYLAYQRRWREFFCFPIAFATLYVWCQVAMLPEMLGFKLPPEKPLFETDYPVRLMVGLAHLVAIFVAFPIAKWANTQMLRLMDYFFPPQVPIKEWIRKAC